VHPLLGIRIVTPAASGTQSDRPAPTETRRADFETQAAVFKALGHPVRLQIVRALEHGGRCVCELQALVGLDMSTVSRHLAQLRTAGVLASRRDGNQVVYSLRAPCALALMDCVSALSSGDEAAARVHCLATARSRLKDGGAR